MEEFIEMDLYGDDDPDGLRTVDRDLWEKMQERTFAAWCNDRLKPRRKFINNRLAVDLNDGTLLINLLQVVSGKNFGSYGEKPKDKFEKLANCKSCFDFMKSEGINLVGIGSDNVVHGVQHPKLILGLIWKIILHYQIDKSTSNAAATSQPQDPDSPPHPLLAWVQSKIPEKNVTNFTKDWRSGVNIAALVDAIHPGLCPEHETMDETRAVENARLAMERAHSHLSVPMVLDPSDLVDKNNNRCCVMTYVSLLRDAKVPNEPTEKTMTDFKAFIDVRASVETAKVYHQTEAMEVMHAVLCNEECSLDSMVSSLAHSYFNEQVNLKFNQASSVLIPLFNAPRSDVVFCTEATYLFNECNVDSSRIACIDDVNLTSLQNDGRLKLTLVDHNRLSSHQKHLVRDVVEILDHHQDETEDIYESTLPIWVDPDVTCTATLIAECYLDQMPQLLEKNPEIIVLLLGTILYTTKNVKITRERDGEVVERLSEMTNVNCDALLQQLLRHDRHHEGRRFLTAYDILRHDYDDAVETPRNIRSGASLLGEESVEEFLARSDARDALMRFVKEKDLALLILMSSSHEEKSCQMSVYGNDEHLVEKVVEYLSKRDDLELSPADEVGGLLVYYTRGNSQRNVVLSHVIDFLKGFSSTDAIISEYSNVMWLSGHHHDDDNIPIIVCAACRLPERSRPDYDTIMQHLYRFCFDFVTKLRCRKFIAVYLYGGTRGKDVDKFGWMRQWYFMLTKKFQKKVKDVYLVHCGKWTERLLRLTGLFMNHKLYEKMTFSATIEELSHFIDVHQINFPEAVLTEDNEIVERGGL